MFYCSGTKSVKGDKLNLYPQLEQVLHDLLVVHLAVLLLALLLHILHLIEHLVLSSKWKFECFIVPLEKASSELHFYRHNLLRILANDPIFAHALDTISSKALSADTLEDVEGAKGSVQPAVSVRITGRNVAAVT